MRSPPSSTRTRDAGTGRISPHSRCMSLPYSRVALAISRDGSIMWARAPRRGRGAPPVGSSPASCADATRVIEVDMGQQDLPDVRQGDARARRAAALSPGRVVVGPGIDERNAAGGLQDGGRDDSGTAQKVQVDVVDAGGERGHVQQRCATELAALLASYVTCAPGGGRDWPAPAARPAKIGSAMADIERETRRRGPRAHPAADQEAGAVQGPAAQRRLHDHGLRRSRCSRRSSTRRRPRRTGS